MEKRIFSEGLQKCTSNSNNKFWIEGRHIPADEIEWIWRWGENSIEQMNEKYIH